MKILREDGLYAVCRFDPARLHGADLADLLAAASRGRFFSLSGTAEEISLVCEAEFAPESPAVESGWRLFKVDGPLDFGLTGILSSIAAPLAAAGISIFAVSTYDTDYILVKDAHSDAAAERLSAAGFEIS